MNIRRLGTMREGGKVYVGFGNGRVTIVEVCGFLVWGGW